MTYCIVYLSPLSQTVLLTTMAVGLLKALLTPTKQTVDRGPFAVRPQQLKDLLLDEPVLETDAASSLFPIPCPAQAVSKLTWQHVSPSLTALTHSHY